MKDFKNPHSQPQNENVFDLMPSYHLLPEDFKKWNGTIWNKAANDWFFSGVKKSQFKPKPGIDADKAFSHLSCIISSWSPKHEHKESGVAYLMSLWFDSYVPSKIQQK